MGLSPVETKLWLRGAWSYSCYKFSVQNGVANCASENSVTSKWTHYQDSKFFNCMRRNTRRQELCPWNCTTSLLVFRKSVINCINRKGNWRIHWTEFQAKEPTDAKLFLRRLGILKPEPLLEKPYNMCKSIYFLAPVFWADIGIWFAFHSRVSCFQCFKNLIMRYT